MEDYIILHDKNINMLAAEEHLAQGYIFVGGLVANDVAFYQAMAKEASGTTKGRRN